MKPNGSDTHHDLGLAVCDGEVGRLDRETLWGLDHCAVLLDLHRRFGPKRVGAAIGGKRRTIEIREQAESREFASDQFQRLMADHGIVCSMSRAGNVWDNAAMESFFSSLKTERTARKTYRTRDQAKADVFDYIERFYNPRRRHSTIGYLSPMEFEQKARLA